jgi:phosphoglucosamine mutase
MEKVRFGSDGIRGKAGEPPFLLPLQVRIGQALGLFLLRRTHHPVVVIGRDTRPSGQDLSTCMSAGLLGIGVDVINVGVMTTPGVAFVTRMQFADMGIIVSASHSPLQMNGIKLLGSKGLRLVREEELEIEDLIERALVKAVDYPGPLGREIEGSHLYRLYIQGHLNGRAQGFLQNLRFVLDCADGAATQIAPDVLRGLGAEVYEIRHSDVDTHINLECGSEYVRSNPCQFATHIRERGADYGLAFDGDGDRLVVVDAQENVFDGDDLLFVLGTHFFRQDRLPRNTVVTTHQTSRALEFALKKVSQGIIKTVYTDNGDRNLEAVLWRNDFLIAGESGGNIIINEIDHSASDAIYTAILLGEVLVRGPRVPLIDLVEPLRKMQKKYPQKIVSFQVGQLLDAEQRNLVQGLIAEKQAFLGKDSRIRYWNSSTEPGVYRVQVEGHRGNMANDVMRAAGEIRDQILNLCRPAARPPVAGIERRPG